MTKERVAKIVDALCADHKTGKPVQFVLSEFEEPRRRQKKTEVEIFEEFQKLIYANVGPNLNVTWNHSHPPYSKLLLDFRRPAPPKFGSPTADLNYLSANALELVQVKNAFIAPLQMSHSQKVVITNCVINDCVLSVASDSRHRNIIFENSWIRNLHIERSGCIHRLEIRGGGILNVECPAPKGANPFTGSVVISDQTFFATSADRFPTFGGPHVYRSLRTHFEALENTPAAAHMRALQFAAELPYERGFRRFLSTAYKIISNYGPQPARPLLFTLATSAVAFVLFLSFDGGVLSAPPGRSELGFVGTLGEGLTGRIGRSALLVAQSVLNPFGALDSTRIIVPREWFGQAILTVSGLLNVLFLVICGLAIRLRFKVSN